MSFTAHLDGTPVTVEVTDDALRVGELAFPYVEMDEVHVDGWAVTLRGPGREVVLDKLGRARDTLLRDLRAARLPARRAALLQSGAHRSLDDYEAKRDEEIVFVGLHTDGITVEGDAGVPVYVPLSCVTDVSRKGYEITIRARALPDLTLRHFGPRTDEFIEDLERARGDLEAATRQAYVSIDPALDALDAPDGWAVTRAEAGAAWEPLRAAFAGTARGDEVALLESLAGDDLRLGIKTAFAGGTLPFALAPHGGRVAVEGTGDEARATFVFATDDVERLNVALLLTSFRREALSLPEDQLGRWAVAARMLEIVRWARAALIARVVHDARWAENVRAALT